MIKSRISFFCFLALLIAFPSSLPAQEAEEERTQYIYEKPNFEKFAQLYWKLGKFDINEDSKIDNFIRITECDIFKTYSHDEFEWKGIREASRQYIKTNSKAFSTRFEIEQGLRFSEYDFEQQHFEIWKPYKIDLVKLFEVLSPDYYGYICGDDGKQDIEGYPKGLYLEIDKFLTLNHIKMTPQEAKEYLDLKKPQLPDPKLIRSNRSYLYDSRDAYLVMKVKVLSFKEDIMSRETIARPRTKVLAALEGFEVYADRKRKHLLYSEEFRQRQDQSRAEDNLRKRFEERKRKREAEKAAKEAKEKKE